MRSLQPGQHCEIRVASVSGDQEMAYAAGNMLLEAPNWTLDGRALVLNGDGRLWRLELASGALTEIPLTGVPALNNDQVLDPEGTSVILTGVDCNI